MNVEGIRAVAVPSVSIHATLIPSIVTCQGQPLKTAAPHDRKSQVYVISMSDNAPAGAIGNVIAVPASTVVSEVIRPKGWLF